MEPLTLIYAALSCWPPEPAEAALPTFFVDQSSVQRSATSAPWKFPAYEVRMSCVQCVKVSKELFQRRGGLHVGTPRAWRGLEGAAAARAGRVPDVQAGGSPCSRVGGAGAGRLRPALRSISERTGGAATAWLSRVWNSSRRLREWRRLKRKIYSSK